MVTKEETRYQRLITVILTLLVLFTLMPFVLLVMSSISSEASLANYGYRFWPKEFSADAYLYILRNADSIFRAYGLTLLVTIVGTLLSLVLTALLAYPLTRKEVKGQKVIIFLIFFTMLFHGGTVPTYILWTQFFHIKNTVWALIIPNLLMNPIHIILMRSYFKNSIPHEIVEAAEIDGANVLQAFRHIILPLGKPIFATIAMFTILAYWNDWTNGLYFVSDPKFYSLQVLLQNILNNVQYLVNNSKVAAQAGLAVANIPSVSIRMAIAVIGILPILILFPFFQGYFVKGISLGAVKG